eukprot:3451836-Amphidinium_carterae.1
MGVRAWEDPALFEQLAGGIEKLGPAGISSLAGHAAASANTFEGLAIPARHLADIGKLFVYIYV